MNAKMVSTAIAWAAAVSFTYLVLDPLLWGNRPAPGPFMISVGIGGVLFEAGSWCLRRIRDRRAAR